MALLDYKITRLSHEGRHVTVTIRVYRGSIGTESESGNGVPTDVTRYRRIALVRERTLDFDVPRDMSANEFARKTRGVLNRRIIDWADLNGHTIISQQQDLTDYEPVLNESEK